MCKCVSKRTSVNNTVLLLLLLQGMVLDNLIGNSIIEAARGEYSEIQRVEYIIVSCARINVVITFFFWIPGFIRSFERVLRVQSRINIRFFLFSSFGVRGKCSTKMISCFSFSEEAYVRIWSVDEI